METIKSRIECATGYIPESTGRIQNTLQKILIQQTPAYQTMMEGGPQSIWDYYEYLEAHQTLLMKIELEVQQFLATPFAILAGLPKIDLGTTPPNTQSSDPPIVPFNPTPGPSTTSNKPIDLNIRDEDGDALLHRAIKQDDSFLALFLLENNCDATLTTSDENNTALHLLAECDFIEEEWKEIAQILINKNVNVNGQNKEGDTALHLAITLDNRPLFDILRAQPSLEFNLRNELDQTPLYYALLEFHRCDQYYALALLEAGAQTDPIRTESGNSLLQDVLEESAQDAAILLATKVTDINHVNLKGESALHIAALENYADFVRKALELGANPNLCTRETGQSPLHYAVTGNGTDCIRAFITYNASLGDESEMAANFNTRDIEGRTPLDLALSLNSESLLSLLIQR